MSLQDTCIVWQCTEFISDIILPRPSPSGCAAGVGNLSGSPSSYHLVLIALLFDVTLAYDEFVFSNLTTLNLDCC